MKNNYKKFPDTLLGYFKNDLWNHKNVSSLKYFNRDFLNAYIKAYNERKRNIENGTAVLFDENGIVTLPEYKDVHKTDFYIKNGTAYCAFCEAWAEWQELKKAFNK